MLTLPRAQSSTATVSPSWTVCPSATVISRTTPALGASTGISIFIDSRTITGSPAPTASPALAVIWNTTPVICALTSSAIERSFLDHLGVHPARAEGGALHDTPVERDHRLDALDHARVQGRRHPGDGLVAGGSRGHQLGQQRVVVYRNFHALGDSGLHADPWTGGHHDARQPS